MMNSKKTYERFPNGEIVKSYLLRQKIMIFTISWHRRLTKWRIQYNLFRNKNMIPQVCVSQRCSVKIM